MDVWKIIFNFVFFLSLCSASYYEKSKDPQYANNKWESYVTGDTEYIIQNSFVSWDNAMILCRGYYNGTMAVLETKEKAQFLAEALAESQFDLTTVWVGARRDSPGDPTGYRWGPGMELSRTVLDVLNSEKDENLDDHFPVWLNRTHVPVPEGGADCVALERVHHDKPVFLDLPCQLLRAFACQRDAQPVTRVNEVETVRCPAGMYHLFDGRLTWHQAAASCVLRGMTLANVGSMQCLRKLGMSMLKNRPSIENAWIGARGTLGKWIWIDSGANLLDAPLFGDATQDWPPIRDRATLDQSGCLQIDRHSPNPVFLKARCERKMQFICYEDGIDKTIQSDKDKSLLQSNGPSLWSRRSNYPGVLSYKSTSETPSDDLYYYVLVKQKYHWQQAYENCLKMNATLANLDNNDILIQLLLLMGENKEKPIEHIWISGRLNMTKDVATDTINYAWYNPNNGKRIPDPKAFGDSTIGLYMPPWLDEEFHLEDSCFNLDRQDHLIGLVYGLPCDTQQYSVCMIAKTEKPSPTPVVITITQETSSDAGYETT